MVQASFKILVMLLEEKPYENAISFINKQSNFFTSPTKIWEFFILMQMSSLSDQKAYMPFPCVKFL